MNFSNVPHFRSREISRPGPIARDALAFGVVPEFLIEASKEGIIFMAKGQQRSNREAKKPKQNKLPPPEAISQTSPQPLRINSSRR